ncbi:MAG TPA: hypothetical protein VIG24_03485 [Acidimicrobiia bacterium]
MSEKKSISESEAAMEAAIRGEPYVSKGKAAKKEDVPSESAKEKVLSQPEKVESKPAEAKTEPKKAAGPDLATVEGRLEHELACYEQRYRSAPHNSPGYRAIETVLATLRRVKGVK